MAGITLDFETADGIVVAVLKEQLQYMKEDLRQHREEGKYMHPEDAYESEFKLVPAHELLIKYYGG